MVSASSERGRITARLPAQVQETLELAASMVGATVNQFVVQCALKEAERIIEQERVIRLSARESQRFLEALDNPAKPNAPLRKALKQHKELLNDQTGTLDWKPRKKQI